eukprot:CAMPEP_0198362782 /NCGR_PEP_ID=MMETSP1450-20131203/147469_1 /TAXON_ID=753684 ORGANISM="Madagascaria erythrocladiodes, Strain CCMP3234" /NCGR_SAMPLE_ID=MMETSP1450 /ASSEMBLY_ACC=CAM_ASM_001115 /LENGTH=171 /DNA_ID=CAMNT_0044070043 /DNA_START=11 /DNA_END=523 /DNA_ORIENTATION=-
MTQVLLDRALLKPGLSVMDFGCGTGTMALEVAKTVDFCLGVDVDESMLSVFRSKIEARAGADAGGRVEAMCVDLTKDGFPNETKFDLIYSSMVLHHCGDIESILTRLQKLLKPGGHLVLLEVLFEGDGSEPIKMNGHDGPRGYTGTELTSALTSVGFLDVSSTDKPFPTDE